METFIEKWKNKNTKRLLENAVIFLVLLVILMIVINSLYTSKEEKTVLPAIHVEKNVETDELEVKLKNILSMIEGAGKVEVMISYLTSEEQLPLYDVKENTTTTEEKDKEGGTRKTQQTNSEQSVIYEENNTNRTPVFQKTKMPEIIGVIIVAEGANNLKVKENLIKAVEAAVEVPSHRIQVFSKQK